MDWFAFLNGPDDPRRPAPTLWDFLRRPGDDARPFPRVASQLFQRQGAPHQRTTAESTVYPRRPPLSPQDLAMAVSETNRAMMTPPAGARAQPQTTTPGAYVLPEGQAERAAGVQRDYAQAIRNMFRFSDPEEHASLGATLATEGGVGATPVLGVGLSVRDLVRDARAGRFDGWTALAMADVAMLGAIPASRAAAKEPVEELLRLEHRTPATLEGGVVDPARAGTGPIRGAERARREAFPELAMQESYFTVAGQPVEARFRNFPVYEGAVPARQVYDLEGDPLGLVARAQERGAAAGQHGGAATAAHLGRVVREAGFKGYRRGDVVAMFDPVEVRAREVPGTRNPAGEHPAIRPEPEEVPGTRNPAGEHPAQPAVRLIENREAPYPDAAGTGTRQFRFSTPQGEMVVDVRPSGPGGHELVVDYVGPPSGVDPADGAMVRRPGSKPGESYATMEIGPTAVREALRHITEAFPDARYISGYRITGAGAGREAIVPLRRLMNDRGAIDPRLLFTTGTTAAGAAVGAASDEDNRGRGAALGAIVGAAVGGGATAARMRNEIGAVGDIRRAVDTEWPLPFHSGDTRPLVTPDGDFIVYHGTTRDAADAIQREGVRGDNLGAAGVAAHPSDAGMFASFKGPRGERQIMELVVDGDWLRQQRLSREGQHSMWLVRGQDAGRPGDVRIPPDAIKGVRRFDDWEEAVRARPEARARGTAALDAATPPRETFSSFEEPVPAAGRALSEAETERIPALLSRANADASLPALTRRALTNVLRYLSPAEAANALGNQRTARRLVELRRKLPSARDFAEMALAGEPKRGWYRHSARALQETFGEDAPRFAALLAASSPQTTVPNNLEYALDVWRDWVAAGRPTDPDVVRRLLDTPAARGYMREGRESREALGAWLNNMTEALTVDDVSSFVLSGPKVDSFANNLGLSPDLFRQVMATTLDTHMGKPVRFAQSSALSGTRTAGGPGWRPGYLAYTALVRETADHLSELTGIRWTPREVQETVWAWVYGLDQLAGGSGSAAAAGDLVRRVGDVTPDMIAETPDFAALLSSPRNRARLEAMGLPQPTASPPHAPGATRQPRRKVLERFARNIERSAKGDYLAGLWPFLLAGGAGAAATSLMPPSEPR